MARSSTPPSPPKPPKRKRTARGGRFAKEDTEAASDEEGGLDVVDDHGLVVVTEPELLRREAFAQAYVALGNATAAARRAGYTGDHVKKTASRLMGEPAVRARIAEVQRDLIRKIKVDQTTVLAELTRIAFADMGKIVDEHGELLPLNKIDEDTRRALGGYKVVRKTFGEDGESVEKEVKFIAKDAALDKLGKHLGLWKADTEDGKFTAEAFLRAMLEARERHIAAVNADRGHDGQRSIQVRQLTAQPVQRG